MPSSLVPPTGRQYSISSAGHLARIVSMAGGIRAYELDGKPVLRGYGESESPPMGDGIILAPWPNRIAGARYRFGDTDHQLAVTEPATGNAIHGLSRYAEWELLEESGDAVTLGHDVLPQQGYPFSIRLSVRWSVGPGGLRADHTATNVGSTAAPFGLGVHPYIDLHGATLQETGLLIPAQEYFATDERDIPTGAYAVEDSEFDFRAGPALGQVRLNTPFRGLSHGSDGRSEVVVRVPGRPAVALWVDRSFDYLQVFTPEDVAGGGPSIAVEPMTCAPDAFNSGAGLLVLEPGDTWAGSWGVKSA